MRQRYSIFRLAFLSSIMGAIALAFAPTANAKPDSTSVNLLPPVELKPEQKSETVVNLPPKLKSIPGITSVSLDIWAAKGKEHRAIFLSSLKDSSNPDKFTKISAANELPEQLIATTIAQLSPTEVKILAPQAATTGEQATNLVVQYAPGAKVQVTVNGKPLNPKTPTQVQPDSSGGVVNQVWYGIPLQRGDNTLTVQAEGGSPVSVNLTVKETAFQLQLQPTSNPQVPADGRSTVTVEGQITDEAGNLITQDAIVTLTASAGKFTGADYEVDQPGFQVLAKEGRFKAQLQSSLATQKVRIRAAAKLQELREVEPGYDRTPLPPIQVSNDGPARSQSLVTPAPLAPITLPLTNQLEAFAQVEFVPNLRPFLLSGATTFRIGAGGTDFYGSFRDFLNPDRMDQDVRFDASVNAFATGRLGDWLLTAALNNQRPLNQVCDGTTRLFRDPQFCDQVYPVYGDSSTTDYLTPSIDSVYARIERNSPVPGAGTDYFMWGDYSTAEFATASQLFTATNRQLHGFKGNYNLGDLQISAMYGNNLQGFQRDTIAPNGTSGYYFLSRRLVLGGSETVFVETEEINRPGTVVARKQLLRGPDYEIDYDRGSLLFRRPIQQFEFDPYGRSLVRRVVVTYQYDGTNTGDTHLFAGRLQYNFSRTLERESWTAFSYLREDEGDRNYELYGVDALIPFGRDGRLIAEFARSSNDSLFFGDVSGNAYRFEVSSSLLTGVVGRAYYRSVDEDFYNNATFSFVPGQTRYGGELAANVGQTTKLQFQIDHESNYGIAPSTLNAFTSLFDPLSEAIPGQPVDNSLTTIRGGVLQRLGAANLSLEWVNRSRTNDINTNLLPDATSNQLVSRFTYPITNTLTFRAQNEQNVGNNGDPLYPSRTTFGVDWAAYPGFTLRLAQQFIATTSVYPANSITSLDALFDYKLAEDTTMTGRYSILNGLGSWGSQTAFGLNHRVKLAPGLRMVLGYERIYSDLFAYTAAGQQFPQAYAVGQSASALGISEGDAYSVGLDYTDNPNFKASGRFEYRTTDLGDNLVISIAGAGKLSPSLTALARYQQANFANQTLQAISSDTINVKFGLAYRNPFDDKFNALLRYEFRQNPSFTPDSILFGVGTGSTAHLVALEAIYTPSYRWEFYGKFGLRSGQSYLAKDLLGTNAITLGQFRTTYRLGYRWDMGGEVRYISQSQTGYNELGFAVEAGYYVTPNIRMAAGYSFGRANDRDLGDRSKGGPYVLFTLKLNELFEGFGLQRAFPENARPKVAPPQQKESLVEPVAVQPPSTTSSTEPQTTSGGQGK